MAGRGGVPVGFDADVTPLSALFPPFLGDAILKEEVRIRIMDPIVKTILIVLGYVLVAAVCFAGGVIYRKKVGMYICLKDFDLLELTGR